MRKFFKKLFSASWRIHFSLFTFSATSRQKGFTLIEMLAVISIIAVLSSIALVSVSNAKAKARDAQRLSDMNSIKKALLLYKEANGSHPSENYECSAYGTGMDFSSMGWDASHFGSDTIQALEPLYFTSVPVDPLAPINGCGVKGSINLYYYKQYDAGQGGCPASRGSFYVLGIKNMETFTGTGNAQHPQSPGVNEFASSGCPTTNPPGYIGYYAPSYFEWFTVDFAK